MKKIYLACDHAGYETKLILLKLLKDFNVVDCGAFGFDPYDDFPDFMHKVGYEVSKDPENSLGIVVGGSGIGEAVLLNRYEKVRCGVCFGSDLEIVKNAREHDDINCLSIGSRYMDVNSIEPALKLFIETPFLNQDKYSRRIKKIDQLIK